MKIKELNKVTKAFINKRPISFNYVPEKSTERKQKPIVRIIDLRVIKNRYLLIYGINLNRISTIDDDVKTAVRSYRFDRMANIKIL